MAPQEWSTNTSNPTPDPAGYQVDDLTIDLAPRRVRRAGTVIPLKALSFDLLVTLVRGAPNLLSFDQLSDRVWPGLVITPETIVQRVKLLRGALGDDPQAPRYIEGVRGRGYRMVAEVRPLKERQGNSVYRAVFEQGDERRKRKPNRAGLRRDHGNCHELPLRDAISSSSLCEMGFTRLDWRNTDHGGAARGVLGDRPLPGAQQIG